MPVIMITPINDMMFSVLPVTRRIITTPASPGGMAMRMMNGSMNEVNWAIRIRYTIRIERISPNPNSLNDWFMLTTAPRTFSTVLLIGLGVCQQLVDVGSDLLQRFGLWLRHRCRSRAESGNDRLPSEC